MLWHLPVTLIVTVASPTSLKHELMKSLVRNSSHIPGLVPDILIHYDGDTFIRAVRNILKYNLKPIHNEQASSIIPPFYSDMSGMQFQ